MAPTSAADPQLRQILAGRGYLRLLLLAALLGVPVAFVSFFFVSAQLALQDFMWEDWPEDLGFDRPPWWWPLPWLLLAGLILAPVVTRMPGGGGHVPAHGLGGPPVGPKALPGVVVAALLTLPLGVVLGPEAPLMALGSGLALLAAQLTRKPLDAMHGAVIATAGQTAAISTILGGPLVAAVLIIEAAGLGGTGMVVVLLPSLLASGAGALVFTGFGDWTGLSTGDLALPTAPPRFTPDAADFLWGIPAAALIAALIAAGMALGRRTERWIRPRTGPRTVLCAVAVGVCVAAYALLTGRNPAEAALSGQVTLGALAADPHAWPVAALCALILFKGLAWGLSLGGLRGGPIFPSILVGAAAGVVCSGLPGLGTTPGMALGIAAAAAAVTGLPLTSSVLTVLLLGQGAYHQTPLVVFAAVVASVVTRLLRRPKATAEGSQPGAGAAAGNGPASAHDSGSGSDPGSVSGSGSASYPGSASGSAPGSGAGSGSGSGTPPESGPRAGRDPAP
ncbi:chloride channel protein [Streptomyces globosus]|uniref:chloride channel protein n=1 Tax=Streptomyces globosus TaxID=68209 RepID=UPI0031D1EC5F